MPLVCAAAGATDPNPHALADLNAADLGDAYPDQNAYPCANGDAHMDKDTNRPTVVYRDPDSNLIVYSHGYLHFDTENYRDLDIDADEHADRDADLHQGAALPDRDKLEHEGRPL